ncbi:acyloxyacyl hydrolase [Ferrovibrio sp.]|uniref:acyloxyacyl hydrolase n=1 Tax=Ferrovibrio sp. TaxID=1917215 RepID=UPI001B564771|nr:acyloxyacyl hydrolase [Ferrovibrio sp.]MBP7064440.1 acyloxyacyl hydrolase [Ferrovibrio sp.]
MTMLLRCLLLAGFSLGILAAMPAQAQYQSQYPQYQTQYPAQYPGQAQPRQQAPAGPVYAQSTQAPQPNAMLPAGKPAAADDPAFWAFSAGWFDLNKQKDQAVEGRIEYRAAEKYWIFKPFGGVMATSDGAVHGFAGVLTDFYFGRRWVVTPSFAPGLYYEGDGKHISNGIQFRSQLEISYRFDDRSRLGLSFNHISNAGIRDPNPGSESLALTYAIPTDKLFKW